MKPLVHRWAKGNYAALLAGLLALAAGIMFVIWAPSHNAMELLIPISLFAGVALEMLLVFAFDVEYIAIAVTALYSIALFRILAGSVGSFVDAFQGIVMFGDSSQVGIIGIMCALIFAAVLASILSCFWNRIRRS